jgi:diketogulonate reductase-like aldo/keto reductase
MSPAGSPQATYEKFLDSVRKIAGDGGFVGLFLIHSTGSGSMGRRHLCQALERLLDSEHRVSNYGVGHIEEMKAYATVWPPHVNQIEVSKHRSIEKSCCCCCCYCQKRRN